MVKVLQVINSLGTGGAEKLLLETIPLYRKAGIEMDVLLLWDNHHAFTKELENKNVCRIFVLNKSQNVRDIYNPINIFKMSRIMKNYSLVHVHLFPAQYFAVVANKLNRSKSKLIFTEHNTSNSRVRNSLFKPVEKWVYRHYYTMICISEEINNTYDQYLKGVNLKKAVIHNGVDVQKYATASKIDLHRLNPEIKPENYVVIQVSAFRPQKDQDTLIKAISLLPENFKLMLVGVGERIEALRNQVEDLKIERKVFFLGQRMDIPQLLKSADVVVLSSHYEGLSLSSVEGMASGKPFVASDVPGLREVVKGAGLLFPKGDAQALANIILQLAKDPAFAEQIAKQGIERAMQYDIHKMTEQHIALYQSLYTTIQDA